MGMFHIRIAIVLTAGAFLSTSGVHAQNNSPSAETSASVVEAARHSRLQKQKNDNPASKDELAANPPAADQANTTQPQGNPSNGAQTVSSAPAKGGVNEKEAGKGDAPKEGKPDKAAAHRSAKRVITNDDIPEHMGPTSTLSSGNGSPAELDQPDDPSGKAPADYWRTRILSVKNQIASLKNDIDEVKASIKFAPEDCVSGCVDWNERQKQKQQQVETMKVQLEEAQKQLEQMQETARQQGYGSSVYDP
jgi:hypothetical protein